jgi:protein TonB
MTMSLSTLSNNTLKFNAVLVAAALITFLLFYFMQFLISTENSNFEPPSITRIMDASVPVFEQELIVEIEKPEVFEPPEEIPLEVPAKTLSPGISVNQPLSFQGFDAPIQTDGTSIPLSRHMVPLVRATAPYPTRALQRGVQGFVELSFTVNAQGRVVDPVVLYAEPEGYFERAALNSIRKWQYSPAMDNGEPVAVHDIRQRIVFEIAED